MPSNSEQLQAAIQEQLTNRVQHRGDDLLCRRCGNVVPEEFRFVFHLPDNESVVWGPYCSEECICHAKICCGCNKDFIVNDPDQIKYFGDGKWYCSECAKSLIHCESCNTIASDEGELIEVDGKKICRTCFERDYFECTECKKYKKKSLSAKEKLEDIEVAKYPTLAGACNKCFEKKKKKLKPAKVVKCKGCGRVTAHTQSNGGFCDVCHERGHVFKCDDCGVFEYIDNANHVLGGIVCNKCKVKYRQCSCCGAYDKKEKGKLYNGYQSYFVCSSCSGIELKECTHCLGMKPKGSFKKYTMSDGSKVEICSTCVSDYSYCSSCKEFHMGEPDCRYNMDGKMGYGYRPALYFNHGGVMQDRVYFGFENEMNFDSQDDYRRALKNVYSKFKATEIYLKSDSSIHGSGFEAVSSPMNYSFLKKMNLANLFAVKPKKDDTSCGLHVHVSRKSFSSQVHMYKFISLINNGSSSFITKIAGRSYNGYNKKIKGKISKHMKSGNKRKYDAVNLSPRDTIEVRVFRGAKTEYQLRYRLEFIHALVSYTRLTSLSKAEDEREFIKWVGTKEKMYPSLYRFLKANFKTWMA